MQWHRSSSVPSNRDDPKLMAITAAARSKWASEALHSPCSALWRHATGLEGVCCRRFSSFWHSTKPWLADHSAHRSTWVVPYAVLALILLCSINATALISPCVLGIAPDSDGGSVNKKKMRPVGRSPASGEQTASKKNRPDWAIRGRCRGAEPLQGRRSFRAAGQPVPSRHADLHSEGCSWCRRSRIRDLLQRGFPVTRSHRRAG